YMRDILSTGNLRLLSRSLQAVTIAQLAKEIAPSYHYQRPGPIDYTSTPQRRLFKKHIDAVEKIVADAKEFFDDLINRGVNPREAGVVIFDVDGTLLTGSFHPVWRTKEIIEPMYYLYHYLISKGFIVDIVTNRQYAGDVTRSDTAQDLQRLGYTGYRRLHMRPHGVADAIGWKAATRKQIAQARQKEMTGAG